jgi:two-component system OmpR family sensor kinase
VTTTDLPVDPTSAQPAPAAPATGGTGATAHAGEGHRSRWPHPLAGVTAGMPLRVRLVALLVAVVAAALAATGFGATSLLKDFLQTQRDGQLQGYATTLAREPQLGSICTTNNFKLTARDTYLACLGLDGPFQELSDDRSGNGLPDVSMMTATNAVEYGQAPFTVYSGNRTAWRVVVVPVNGQFAFVYAIDLANDRAVVSRLVALELFVGLLVLVVIGLAGQRLIRNSLRPLEEVEVTARSIAAGDLSRRVPEGDERTEVGRLSNALNGMLGRIEHSFRAQQVSEEQAVASEARMRRFVADASHELRTPLTSIRGFAELHRQGAVRDPAEVQRLMQRIESEATRMGLLVEDLLQLARLDQQRPLDVVPVDLAELAEDALHDARAVSPGRPLDLVLDPSLTEVPVVLGDEARLRQVIGNLVTNAVTHTPAGTPVTVRLAEPADDPDSVCVVVADRGPGMAPADAERVFERFYRADASRTRAAGGSGLGLSIVASLVAAHGGRVDLTTAPGEGATFTVRLPRSGPTGG